MRPSGLARFIAWQVAILIGVFLVQTIASTAVTTRLEQMMMRVNDEAIRMNIANDIAIEMLMYRRDALLARVTNDTSMESSSKRHLESAASLLDRLSDRISDPVERRTFGGLLRQHAIFQESLAQKPINDPIEYRGRVDRVIVAVEEYRQLMQARMDAVEEDGRQLNRLADGILWSLACITPFVLVASGLSLWRRIARPVFGLVEAAERFGAGDLGARAPLHRQDELGILSRTFNSMADDIQAREQDRHNFMCAVVHDLSSPIAVIGGAAHLLLNGLPPDKARHWHERVLEQSNRLSAMNDDLMESARIGAGQLRIERKMVDLSRLASTIVTEQKLVHGQRTINWRQTEPIMLLIDEKRIARVLANLITNAVKYSDPPAEIDVRIDLQPGKVIVAIADHGSGMSREEIEQLFKPFGRLARTNRKTRGTGLGLYSVKQIMKAHDGSLEVDSEPGRGTTVRAIFPRTPGNLHPPSSSQSTAD